LQDDISLIWLDYVLHAAYAAGAQQLSGTVDGTLLHKKIPPAELYSCWRNLLYSPLLSSIPFWQQKGGDSMIEILISFLISLMASVVSYYICKWLERKRKKGDD
jgi:hypothetical protein